MATTKRAATDAPQMEGVSSVTDEAGNPLPPQAFVGRKPSSEEPAKVPDIQRGQGWWPYRVSLPPYTPVNKAAEEMTADEIQVNGVAILDVRNAKSALQQVPKDLLL